jgi:hypothetical protein
MLSLDMDPCAILELAFITTRIMSTHWGESIKLYQIHITSWAWSITRWPASCRLCVVTIGRCDRDCATASGMITGNQVCVCFFLFFFFLAWPFSLKTFFLVVNGAVENKMAPALYILVLYYTHIFTWRNWRTGNAPSPRARPTRPKSPLVPDSFNLFLFSSFIFIFIFF